MNLLLWFKELQPHKESVKVNEYLSPLLFEWPIRLLRMQCDPSLKEFAVTQLNPSATVRWRIKAKESELIISNHNILINSDGSQK